MMCGSGRECALVSAALTLFDSSAWPGREWVNCMHLTRGHIDLLACLEHAMFSSAEPALDWSVLDASE